MGAGQVESLVQFDMKSITDVITRKSGTTPYTAGDVVSNDGGGHLVFSRAVREGGSWTGQIVGAMCRSTANVATKPDLELWLFRDDFTEVDDGGVFAPSDAELSTLVGIITFPTASWYVGKADAGADGNAVCPRPGLSIPFKAAGADDNRTLYGQLVVRNGYVPVTLEEFHVTLMIVWD